MSSTKRMTSATERAIQRAEVWTESISAFANWPSCREKMETLGKRARRAGLVQLAAHIEAAVAAETVADKTYSALAKMLDAKEARG